jgi:hypothetical protein
LLILEFGSLAVLLEVFFARIPHILPQKDLRRAADLGDLAASAFLTGGLRFIPCALALARPLALRPPFGFLPSAFCQAGVAIVSLALVLAYRMHLIVACRMSQTSSVILAVRLGMAGNQTLQTLALLVPYRMLLGC